MQIHCLEQDLKENFHHIPVFKPPLHGYDLPIGTMRSIKLNFESYMYFWGGDQKDTI